MGHCVPDFTAVLYRQRVCKKKQSATEGAAGESTPLRFMQCAKTTVLRIYTDNKGPKSMHECLQEAAREEADLA